MVVSSKPKVEKGREEEEKLSKSKNGGMGGMCNI